MTHQRLRSWLNLPSSTLLYLLSVVVVVLNTQVNARSVTVNVESAANSGVGSFRQVLNGIISDMSITTAVINLLLCDETPNKIVFSGGTGYIFSLPVSMQSLTINGNGVILESQVADLPFISSYAKELVMNDLTIQKFTASNPVIYSAASTTVVMNRVSILQSGTPYYPLIQNSGTLRMSRCTVANSNVAVLFYAYPSGDSVFEDLTVFGCRAFSGFDIYVSATFKSTTIYGNNLDGALVLVGSASTTVVDSIILKNVGYDIMIGGSASLTIQHSMYNKITGTPSSTSSNIVGLNTVGISDLADNGGPVKTCAVDQTSLAYNAGSVTDVSTDARGAQRKCGLAPDIGAYEFITTGCSGPTSIPPVCITDTPTATLTSSVSLSVTVTLSPSTSTTTSVTSTASPSTLTTPTRTVSTSTTPSVSESVSPSVSITSTVSVSPSNSATPTVTATLSPSTSTTTSVTSTASPSTSTTPSVTVSVSPSTSMTSSVTPTISSSNSVTLSTSLTATTTESLAISSSPSVTPSLSSSVTSSVRQGACVKGDGKSHCSTSSPTKQKKNKKTTQATTKREPRRLATSSSETQTHGALLSVVVSVVFAIVKHFNEERRR